VPAILANEADSENVAAYLATLKDPKRKAPDLKRSEEKAKQGEELFNTIGCANCHPPHTLDAMKWQSIGQLAAYLKDPLAVDRSGRMPSMNLTDEEAAALADAGVVATLLPAAAFLIALRAFEAEPAPLALRAAGVTALSAFGLLALFFSVGWKLAR